MTSLAKGQFDAAAQLRIVARLLAMAVLLIACVILFYLWELVRAPNPWPRIFLAKVARLSGVRIRTMGQPAPGQLLILANHISWIDIPGIAAATGTAFVAQDGLAQVPLLNWLCKMNDTVFVARFDRASVRRQVAALRTALAQKHTITVFPETTTTNGSSLLPFKSSLLAALGPLPVGIVVQPVWLDYGPDSHDIAWIGVEAGIANFLRVLARSEPMTLTVHFLEPLTAPALANRKTMTAAAYQAIEQAIGGLPAQRFCEPPSKTRRFAPIFGRIAHYGKPVPTFPRDALRAADHEQEPANLPR